MSWSYVRLLRTNLGSRLLWRRWAGLRLWTDDLRGWLSRLPWPGFRTDRLDLGPVLLLGPHGLRQSSGLYGPCLRLSGAELSGLPRLAWTHLWLLRLSRADLRLLLSGTEALLDRHWPSHRTLHSTVCLDGMRGRNHRRSSAVCIEELLPVLRSLLACSKLGLHRRKPRLAARCNLRRTRTDLDTARAAVV